MVSTSYIYKKVTLKLSVTESLLEDTLNTWTATWIFK